jgi:hypothetical protein
VGAKSFTTSQKKFVVVGPVVGAFGDSLEAIQVQLPLERAKLSLIEKRGNYFLLEPLWFQDSKRSSMRFPPHNVRILIVHEHAVQTLRERNSYAPIVSIFQW